MGILCPQHKDVEMFNNYKLKIAKKKIRAYIDNLAYDDAYEYMLDKVVGLSKPLVKMNTGVVYNLLTSLGMPESHANKYNAQYEYECAMGRHGENEKSAQTKKELYRSLLNIRHDLKEINEYEKVRLKIEFEQSLTPCSENHYQIKVLTNQLNHLRMIMPEASEDEIEKETMRLKEEIILYRFRDRQISYLDYEKSVATLHDKAWFNYQIELDPAEDRPDAFVLNFDFNKQFVNWLVKNEVTLTPYESEGVDPDSEEYDELLVEKWAKSSLISLAATMLAEDGGETFRSVVASEPEGTIVQHLEIDRDNLEEYYGDALTPEQIQDIAEKTRNRRMYK